VTGDKHKLFAWYHSIKDALMCTKS
jgi:hypothetical protein